MDSSDALRCRLSDPSHPHYLSDIRDGLPPSDCFTCGQRHSKYYSEHYYCEACDVHFHKGCHANPRKIRHPYHPQHPLSFTYVDKSENLVSDGHVIAYFEEYGEPKLSYPHNSQGKCDQCGEDLGSSFYRCSICSFSLGPFCFSRDPALTIANPMIHEHTLTMFHRPLLTPCDGCGIIKMSDTVYTCHQCNYVVHSTCIGLPRVIKIPYHSHRLFHKPYLPLGIWLCGVCHRYVDFKYATYSCIQGCSSVFHSECATNKEIWDGEELEWEPEEPEEIDDIEPFLKISDREILHFSHDHQLWFNKETFISDTSKQCEACVLPIGSSNFYSCMQCDFFLHATCASLPRKKEHVLHCHPLILDPHPVQEFNSMRCSACKRISTGFRYTCNKCDFKLDVKCASVSNSFSHVSHEHPLFIWRYHYFFDRPTCQYCGILDFGYYLKCIYDGCDFVLCLKCATFPDEVHYKYDEHLLRLHCGEDASDPYWCEVCEGVIMKNKWFYTCDACSVTLHVGCAFGYYVYMKYGRSFKYEGRELEIVRNSSSTRPFCSRCLDYCGYRVFFKEIDQCFCSLRCAEVRGPTYHHLVIEKHEISTA